MIDYTSDDHTKIQEIKHVYNHSGLRKQLFGDRTAFDKADHRAMYRTRTLEAFIEVIQTWNRRNGKFNLVFVKERLIGKHIAYELLKHCISQYPRIQTWTVSCHLKDSNMANLFNEMGFKVIDSRRILLLHKLPLDGMHLSYIISTPELLRGR